MYLREHVRLVFLPYDLTAARQVIAGRHPSTYTHHITHTEHKAQIHKDTAPPSEHITVQHRGRRPDDELTLCVDVLW